MRGWRLAPHLDPTYQVALWKPRPLPFFGLPVSAQVLMEAPEDPPAQASLLPAGALELWFKDEPCQFRKGSLLASRKALR